VLDFGLGAERVALLLREGLELVAARARYSLRELVGTLIALHHPELRGRQNILANERSMYCSAFVQRLFRQAGIELAPGVDGKNTTPDDISGTPVPHTTYLLERAPSAGKRASAGSQLKQQVQAHVRRLKKTVSGT
jgi:hypothetical protein